MLLWCPVNGSSLPIRWHQSVAEEERGVRRVEEEVETKVMSQLALDAPRRSFVPSAPALVRFASHGPFDQNLSINLQ